MTGGAVTTGDGVGLGAIVAGGFEAGGDDVAATMGDVAPATTPASPAVNRVRAITAKAATISVASRTWTPVRVGRTRGIGRPIRPWSRMTGAVRGYGRAAAWRRRGSWPSAEPSRIAVA